MRSVVSTPLKNIAQLGWLFPIYGFCQTTDMSGIQDTHFGYRLPRKGRDEGTNRADTKNYINFRNIRLHLGHGVFGQFIRNQAKIGMRLAMTRKYCGIHCRITLQQWGLNQNKWAFPQTHICGYWTPRNRLRRPHSIPNELKIQTWALSCTIFLMPGISSTCGDEDRVLMDLGREHGLGTQLGCFATSAQSNGALLRTFDGSPNLSEFACRGNRLVVRVPAYAYTCHTCSGQQFRSLKILLIWWWLILG